jgi:MOSC domain-containing protein YiiM
MKKIANILGIFSAKVGQKSMPRPRVDKLIMVKDSGIKNDKFANKNLDQTVMIVGQIAYDIAKQHNISLKAGSFGENILLDTNPHILDIGTILHIGDSVLKITYKCSICKHLATFDNRLPALVKEYRGGYCKILKGGKISSDMVVSCKID